MNASSAGLSAGRSLAFELVQVSIPRPNRSSSELKKIARQLNRAAFLDAGFCNHIGLNVSLPFADNDKQPIATYLHIPIWKSGGEPYLSRPSCVLQCLAAACRGSGLAGPSDYP